MRETCPCCGAPCITATETVASPTVARRYAPPEEKLIPLGWKLVPLTPTDSMMHVFIATMNAAKHRGATAKMAEDEGYRAMVSVAGEPPEIPPLDTSDFLSKHPSERTGCHGEAPPVPTRCAVQGDKVTDFLCWLLGHRWDSGNNGLYHGAVRGCNRCHQCDVQILIGAHGMGAYHWVRVQR